jgi:hypothetical protein
MLLPPVTEAASFKPAGKLGEQQMKESLTRGVPRGVQGVHD